MSDWHFYALQQLSDEQSRAHPTENSLGMAIFRLTGEPPEGPHEFKIYERDTELSEGDRRRQASDDPLGTLRCTVDADGAVAFETPLFEPAGSDSDPTVTVVIQLPSDRALPASPIRHWTVPLPAAATRDDADPWLELGIRKEGEGWEHQAPVRLRSHRGVNIPWWPNPGASGNEWDGRTPPIAGQTYQGYEFERDRKLRIHSGVLFTIRRPPNDSTSDRWGVMYGGKNAYSSLVDAVLAAADEYRASGEFYRALAAEALEFLAEGGASAINTYDNQYVTLGMGWGASANDDVIENVQGPTRETLTTKVVNRLACFENGVWDSEHYPIGTDGVPHMWTDPTRALRLDMRTYARYVQLSEHRAYCFDIVRSNLRTFVENDCVGKRSAARARIPEANTWAESTTLREARGLIGNIGYLHHGRPTWLQEPIDELLAVVNETRLAEQAARLNQGRPETDHVTVDMLSTPSARMALVLKRHAEISFRRNNAAAKKLITRSLGRKIEVFENCMNALREPDETEFEFNVEEAAKIIPCFVGGPSTRRNGTRNWALARIWEGVDPRHRAEDDPAEGEGAGDEQATAGGEETAEEANQERVILRCRPRRGSPELHYDFGPPVMAPDAPNNPIHIRAQQEARREAERQRRAERRARQRRRRRR